MAKGEVAGPVKDEIPSYLGQVELLGMPDLATEGDLDVLPDNPWRRDRPETAPVSPNGVVAEPFRIRQPQVGMPQVASEAGDVIGARERDDRDPASQGFDLVDVVPQLREMLLAIESTQITEQDQDGRPS